MPEGGFGKSKSAGGEDGSEGAVEEDAVGVMEVVEIIGLVGVIGLGDGGFTEKVEGFFGFLKLYNFMKRSASLLGMVHMSSMKTALVKVEAV